MFTSTLAALFPLLAPAYDPLVISNSFKPSYSDLTLTDASRKREVPIRVYWPKEGGPAPVVLFSHGLGGSRENNGYLGQHFSARGYVVVHTQHIGSDESVWKGVSAGKRMDSMRKAASGENLMLRIKDVSFVLDELERLNTSDAKFKGRLDLTKVGMSGHSFGAMTTQATSGQSFPGVGQRYTDSRIKAAITYSGSAPGNGNTAKSTFGSVKIPWLVMTGTHDTSVIGGATVETRKAVFPALPAGDKYGLVLFEAEHSAFSERGLPGDRNKRNPNHHRAILGLSTAFWDAYLKGNSEAKAWLKGSGAKAILEPKDEWSTK